MIAMIDVLAITLAVMVGAIILERRMQAESKYGRPRGWSAAFLAVALFFTVAIDARAQEGPPKSGSKIHRSPPPQGAKTHTAVPGERFRAGGFKRWLWGGDYRDLWTTPLEIPVLDLDSVGGGLTPLRTGGFGQSISLHFTGKDGRRYTVRSLDKDPTRRIMEELKETFVESILQDGISSLLPTAGLVVDPLLEAAGILHSKHTLVIIPDDPRLGQYREEFAGLIGTLQLHPSEGPDNTPGFAGSININGSDRLWKRLEKSPCDRIDSRAFLKARLMDFLINDKDRHAGQWRWARFPKDDCYTWVPIPEDRDQAFIELDGLAMALARIAIPRQIKFGENFPNLIGLSITGWEVDREVLVDLERPVWESVAAELQADLTDQVIEDAVRRLPEVYYEMVGDHLTRSLKARRDKLPAYALKYYRLITRQAEIWATDKDEYAEFEHKSDGALVVRIGLTDGSGTNGEAPYYQRTFYPNETKEVRLYLRGGSDRTEVLGEQGKIMVRVDGGGGDDTFVNRSRTGAGKTRFYDSRGQNKFEKGKGAKIDRRRFKHPAATEMNMKRAFDWGGNAITFPFITVSPDLGVFVGAISGRERYGYRKFPFAVRHDIGLGIASKGPEPFIAYTGMFRLLWPNIDGTLHLEYSGINVIRFNGLGNETEIPGSTSFYKVSQKEFVFAPGIAIRAGESRRGQNGSGKATLLSTFSFGVGPIVKYSDTPSSKNEDHFIGSFDSPVYGTESFGQLGVQGEFKYDTRDNSGYASSGVLLRLAGVLYPEVWDVASTFGNINGDISTYLTANMPTTPTLALRAGGEKVWGTFPFHEAAYLGGPSNLRGYRQDRFGGDASLYGNAELRFGLFDVKILVPGEFGLFGAMDTGRVFFDGDPDDADEWHTGVGGGFWLSFLHRMQTLSVGIMNGDDLTGVYLSAGFMF